MGHRPGPSLRHLPLGPHGRRGSPADCAADAPLERQIQRAHICRFLYEEPAECPGGVSCPPVIGGWPGRARGCAARAWRRSPRSQRARPGPEQEIAREGGPPGRVVRTVNGRSRGRSSGRWGLEREVQREVAREVFDPDHHLDGDRGAAHGLAEQHAGDRDVGFGSVAARDGTEWDGEPGRTERPDAGSAGANRASDRTGGPTGAPQGEPVNVCAPDLLFATTSADRSGGASGRANRPLRSGTR